MKRSLLIPIIVLLGFTTIPFDTFAKVADCTIVKTGEAEAVSFITKTKEGDRLPIEGVLMKPKGKGSFPGMVILHGSNGIFPPRCYGGALSLFVELGYASLLIDSTSAKRYEEGLGGYTFADQAQDALKGREFLTTIPFVKPDSIGVIGWSRGGGAILDAVSRTKGAFPMEKDNPFQAAVAFYPFCFGHLKELDAPLLILIGEEDTQTPAYTCKNMKVTKHAGMEYQLKVYPGVGHVFEAPWSPSYNEEAAEDSIDRLEKFFAKYLQK